MKPLLIVDTDFETDCDDAGALAILHGLADQGVLEIGGICASVHSPWPAAGVKAFNCAFGREEIPVATNRITANGEPYSAVVESVSSRLYHRAMSERYPQSDPGVFQPEEAVDFYFRRLEAAPDHGVTICAIGLLTSLWDFLRREGAIELIRRKVRLLVTMAEAEFPAGADGFNWNMDRRAAAGVLDGWPGEIVVTSLGRDVLTAAYPCRDGVRGEMLKLAYRRMGGGSEMYRRSSWDLIAVLYSAKLLEGETALSAECRIAYNPGTGRHTAFPQSGGKRRFLLQKSESCVLEKIVQRYLNDSCAPAAEGESWAV